MYSVLATLVQLDVNEHACLSGVGWMVQAVALLLGILFPVVLAIMRLSVSTTALTWYDMSLTQHPCQAILA